MGEEDERQHKDEDLPGAAAEGRVRHPSPVGRLNLDLVSVPLPRPVCPASLDPLDYRIFILPVSG